jgi:hypothetical protein
VVAGLVAAVVVFLLSDGEPVPSKDDPAAYTRHVVQQTIDRYQQEGLEATLVYVNSVDSVDGPWYPFVIGEDGYTIGHHNPVFRNRHPSERVDSSGHFYGDDILSAVEEGRWITYVILDPETGEERRKHTWVVLHDGLIFGSGWYETEP